MIEKPDICQGCPINRFTGKGFVPINDIGTRELIVGDAPSEDDELKATPFSGGQGVWLTNLLRNAKQDRSNFCITNTICCRPTSGLYPTDDRLGRFTQETAWEGVQYCVNHFLRPLILSRKWSRIFAIGEKALNTLTGFRGLEQWRGSSLPMYRGLLIPHTIDKTPPNPPVVIPTIHPLSLMRNPKLASIVVGDLKRQPGVPPENYTLDPSIEEVDAFKAIKFAFDFEWDWQGNITYCGLSDRMYTAIVVPFRDHYIYSLRQIFERAEVLIGHNIISADIPHLDRLGWDISKAKIVDTLLQQHLIQPDMRHGLSFVSSVFTSKVFWKGADREEEEDGGIGGAQYKTWNNINAIPVKYGGYAGCKDEDEAFCLYNARDTDASYQIHYPLETLLERYNLTDVYENVSVPVAYICHKLGDAGMVVDRNKLIDIREELDIEIERLDKLLPEEIRSRVIMKEANMPNTQKTYKLKKRTCKGLKGSKHDPWVLEFTSPGTLLCPVCGREIESGKMTIPKTIKGVRPVVEVPWNSPKILLEYAKDQGLPEYLHKNTKKPTSDKNARKRWASKSPEFATVDQLKKANTLKTSFAKPGLVSTDRMFFSLLTYGTAEGRLSSKAKRKNIDMQIQNIPKSIRKIFIPDREDWCFGSFDVIQGENTLTAWFAKDWERIERLADPDYDEHSETATACFGIPVTKTNANKHLRLAGKIVNHGLNYGAGWKTLQDTLALHGYMFEASDCKDIISAWRELNKRTAQWQDETIKLATGQGYLVNPFGRRRWFQTRDIGPKSLAFLPASTLADCVLRMMIAMHYSQFSANIYRLGLKEYMDFTPPYRMVTQVHDEILITGPYEGYEREFANVKRVMEQPWRELGGFNLRVEAKLCRNNWGTGEVIEL